MKSFDEIRHRAKQQISSGRMPRVGIIYPRGGKCMDAVTAAAREQLIKVSLLGPKSAIEECIAKEGCDLCGMEIVGVDSLDEAVNKGVEMASGKQIDFLMKGAVGTCDLVDVLMKPENGFFRKGTVISHIGIMQTERYHKLMFITDAAVNSEPDANAKIAIARNAADLARKLGVDKPKAALLAAVEAIYPAVPVTMEEAAIAKMSDRGQIKDVLIDGPLSFDVAIKTEVAHSKGIINSTVAGETDIFIGPSMETANGLYKAMVMYVKAESAGLIYGGPVPLVSNFNVDSIGNVTNSILVGALLSLASVT